MAISLAISASIQRRIVAVWGQCRHWLHAKLGDLELFKVSSARMRRSSKRDRSMKVQRHLTAGLVGIVLVTVAALPLRAADPALEGLKAEIDAVISGFAPGTNGVLEWLGSDPFEIRRDGDDLLASISNARVVLHADKDVRLALDRIDI